MAVLLAGFLAGCAAPAGGSYPWKPDKPVTIIVPWAAGGSTDQMVRIVAAELEAALGVAVPVVNQPGATGSIGLKNALAAPADGYTWSSGSSGSLGILALLELAETRLDEWHVFLTLANVPVVSVARDSPYRDFGELLADLGRRPETISVGTAGVGSTGHRVMELTVQRDRLSYRHMPFPGGRPAVLATANGEVAMTTQLAADQADLIRDGRLRPLAALSREPLELAGYGRIPPITQWLPGLEISTDYFGIWVRRGAPPEVVATMAGIWNERIANSSALREYARRNGAIFLPIHGEEAHARSWATVRADAWALRDLGLTRRSPEEFGIPRLRER